MPGFEGIRLRQNVILWLIAIPSVCAFVVSYLVFVVVAPGTPWWFGLFLGMAIGAVLCLATAYFKKP